MIGSRYGRSVSFYAFAKVGKSGSGMCMYSLFMKKLVCDKDVVKHKEITLVQDLPKQVRELRIVFDDIVLYNFLQNG